MSIRAIPFVLAVVACALGGAAPALAQKSSPPAPAAPEAPNLSLAATAPMEFYLAHGEPNACGPGCSEWIAAEGKIELGTADRLRPLLRKLGDRRPPIYFHSPGGFLAGALELGRLIRDRKFEVSVGHTAPLGCSSDKQAGNSCEAQKRAGKAIEAEISRTIAQCNSACVYALAGGAVRLVPPWVKLGVHDAGFDPNSHQPRAAAQAAALQEIHARIRIYLREMGIDDALFSLTLATPFHSAKFLQRDDVVRFGIDRREFGTTSWRFFDEPMPKIRNLFFVRMDGDQPRYVDGVIEIGCSAGRGYLLMARHQLETDTPSLDLTSTATSVAISGKRVNLHRVMSAEFYVRSGLMTINTLDAIGDDATIELPGSEFGRPTLGNVTLAMDGFSAASAKLQPRCSAMASAASWPTQTGPVGDPRAAGWVAQLPHTKEPVGDPQTAQWLSHLSPGKGSVPDAPVAATQNSALTSGKGTEALEITRVAAAEQQLRLDFLYKILPGCSSAGQLTVRVLEQPQHGALSIEKGQASTDFPKDDERAVCNEHPSSGTLVFYQPGADYRGADSITLYVVSPLGDASTRHYAIEVK